MFSDIDPHATAYFAGQVTGQLAVALLALLGAGKCLAISRRPATNGPCVWSLALFLMIFPIAVAENVFSHFNLDSPTISLLIGVLKLGMAAAAAVLAIIGLVQYR